MKGLLVITSVFLSISTVNVFNQEKGTFCREFDNHGIISSICYHVPDDYDSTKKYPMLLGWHGTGMPASDMRDMLYNVNTFTDLDAIIVCPDINNVQTDEQFTEILKEAHGNTQKKYNIDTNMIVLTGFSTGGQFAYRLGLQYYEFFAGIIGVSPYLTERSFHPSLWDNAGNIRMAAILGDQDYNFDSTDYVIKKLLANGGHILYKIKKDVTHTDFDYFNSFEFLNDFYECYLYVTEGISSAADSEGEVCKIQIYPNPAGDYVNITAVHDRINPEDISLVDVYGNNIIAENAGIMRNRGSVRINTSELSPGIYFIKFSVGRNMFLKKFIVAR